jgi:hypothetical protein
MTTEQADGLLILTENTFFNGKIFGWNDETNGQARQINTAQVLLNKGLTDVNAILMKRATAENSFLHNLIRRQTQ